MILYHGSNVEVRTPKLLKIQRKLDFGSGFYTTTDLQQAVNWAKRTRRIRKGGEACISVYEFPEGQLDTLHILHFEKADEKWLDFVTANRKDNVIEEQWDIVFGPVANDQTMQILILYLDGFLTKQETIARLLPQKLTDQVTFKTEKALACLKCKEVKRL